MTERIRQGYISPVIGNHAKRFMKLFDLIPYKDVNAPAVFFYNLPKYDLDIIEKHKGYCVVVITSSHTIELEKAVKIFVEKGVKLIATSKVSETLTEMDITHECPKNGIIVEKVDPVILGNSVYAFTPKPHFHPELVEQIKTKYPMIVHHDLSIPMEEWYAEKHCYNKIFIGLNLAENSGGIVTIIDLGLRGIRCVTNVIEMAHTIPWKTIEDIENAIENESKYIGTINADLAREVYESMDYEQRWLEIG